MKALYAKLLMLGIFFSASSQAETIITKNLHTLNGQIVAQTNDWIELRMEFGTLRIPRANIARIEQDTQQMAVECSYTAEQSKDFADKMKAEGKILYHGRWVTPEEKADEQARIDEAKRRAAKELAEQKQRAQEEADREADAQDQVDSQIEREEARYYVNHYAPYNVRQRILGRRYNTYLYNPYSY